MRVLSLVTRRGKGIASLRRPSGRLERASLVDAVHVVKVQMKIGIARIALPCSKPSTMILHVVRCHSHEASK